MANDQKQCQSTPNKLRSRIRGQYAFYLIFFVGGMSIGLASSLYLTTISLYFQTTFTTPILSIPSVVSSSPPTTPSPQKVLHSSLLPPTKNTSVIILENLDTVSAEFLMQNVSDEELLLKASRVPVQVLPDHEHVSKLAFMFLVKGGLPFAPLWENFFKGQRGLYSIYIHTNPSYKDKWSVNSVFYGRRIFSQPVIWGTSTMVDAERRLLARALLDPSNQRFILLSESCIPMFNFNTVYDYLINADLSMVKSYDIPGRDSRDRYNPKMSPLINVTHWRKGSQWFEVRRDLAIHIISDQKYYKIFQEYCLPRCYVDEHYIPTLANILYPELISNRSVTYVDWSKRGPHPAKFGWENVTEEFLNGIRFGSECVYNGHNTTKCFLFARKFHPSALDPLLRVAPVLLGFGP